MVDIRIAEKSDAEIITQIINNTWKVTYENIVPECDIVKYTDYSFRLNKVSEYLADGKTVFLIANYNSSDCGVISFCEYNGENFDNCANILQLYVLPAFQKKNIGKALLDYALHVLIQRGYKTAVLNTLEKNMNARSFYERNGFEFCGTEFSPLFSEKVVRRLYKKEL